MSGMVLLQSTESEVLDSDMASEGAAHRYLYPWRGGG